MVLGVSSFLLVVVIFVRISFYNSVSLECKTGPVELIYSD